MPYCNQCGKEVKDEDKFCSSCGEKFEKEETIPNKPIQKKKSNSTVLYIFLAVLAILTFKIGTSEDDSSPSKAAVKTFITNHTNLNIGNIISTEDKPDWAKGKRVGVVTNNGYFLFYLKDNAVVTVYKDTKTNGRVEIYRH